MATITLTKASGVFYNVTESGAESTTSSTYVRYNDNGNGNWLRAAITVPVGHIYTITQFYTSYTGYHKTYKHGYGITTEKRDVYVYSQNSSFSYSAICDVYGSSAGNTYTTSVNWELTAGTWYLYIYQSVDGGAIQFLTSNSTAVQITYTDTTLPTYTISYNANGGTGAPSSQTKIEDVTLTLSTTKPSKANGSNTVTGSFNITGNAYGGYFGSTSTTTTKITATTSRTDTIKYTFVNWNTASNGSGTSYASGGSYTANAAVTLYAQYSSSTTTGTTSYTNNSISALTQPIKDNTTQATYTVTFNANGGSCSTTSLSSNKTRTYNFKGWSATEGGTTVLNSNTTYTSATTVWAVWGQTDSTAAITLPTPTRTGYTFKGWATSASATSGTTGSYTPTQSVTLYAIWEANGAVRIYVDGEYKMALVYLYDGSSWRLTLPYLYNGSWKLSG